MTNSPVPDVVIIGGGAAGSSAALVLGRARARVLLIDAGQPSNLPSTGIGGLLGNDGTRPADFYRRAAQELDQYPGIDRRSGTVREILHHDGPRWQVELDDGLLVLTDRVLIATGMRYALPDIPGIEERWGSSVFHCPFCHGWEHRDQPLAVLGGPAERALLLRRWTDDLALVTGGEPLTDEERARLDRAGIRIVEGTVAALHGPGQDLDGLTLVDGTFVHVTGLMVTAPHEPRRPGLLDGLGLAVDPSGHLVTDAFGGTSVPGIWAAGDVSDGFPNVARAVAAGSTTAAAITRDLLAQA